MFNVYLFSSTPRPITTTAPNQIFTEPSEDSDNAFFGLQIQNEKELQNWPEPGVQIATFVSLKSTFDPPFRCEVLARVVIWILLLLLVSVNSQGLDFRLLQLWGLAVLSLLL